MEKQDSVRTNVEVFSIRNVVRGLLLFGMIGFFCPTFLVSCQGAGPLTFEEELGMMDGINGYYYMSEEVIPPLPFLWVLLIIPAIAFLVTFVKLIKDKAAAIIITVLEIINIAAWLLVKALIDDSVKGSYRNQVVAEPTFWYYAIIISGILIVIISFLIIIGKINWRTGIIGAASTNGDVEPNTVNGASSSSDGQTIVASLKNLPKVVYFGIAGVVVAIVIISIIMGIGPSINMNDYVVITTEGFDGYADVQVSVDWNSIEEKYGNDLKFTQEYERKYGTTISPIEFLKENVTIEIEEYESLSNGDKLEYEWKIDASKIEYLNCKLSYENDTISVSNLDAVPTFDAFEGVSCIFSGVSPMGTVRIEATGELSSDYFVCDVNSGVSNGDKITVSLPNYDEEYFVEYYGKIPECFEKTFTVEGLNSYATKLDELSSDIETLKNQAKDVFYSHVAKDWDKEHASLENFTYLGEYLLTQKSFTQYEPANKLFLVYKGQAHIVHSQDGKTFDKLIDFYWYLEYNDVMYDASGKMILDITSYGVPSKTIYIDTGLKKGWFSTWSYYLYGYENLEGLYNDVVSTNLAKYSCEKHITETP